MRLTDIEIEQCLDDGTMVIESRPRVDAISGVSVDVKLVGQFCAYTAHTAPYIDLSGPSAEVPEVLISRISQDD